LRRAGEQREGGRRERREGGEHIWGLACPARSMIIHLGFYFFFSIL